MASAFALTAPGGPELVVILVLAVLLFGAKKLPDLGSAVGQSIKNFKKGVDEGKDERQDEQAEQAGSAQDAHAEQDERARSQTSSQTPPTDA